METQTDTQVTRSRQAVFVSLIVLGIVIVAIAGGWYLLQPSGEVNKITIFTISDLSPTNSSADEHPGTLALDFSLTDPEGASSWLSDFRGKVVVINFMATWCVPCRQEILHLNESLNILWEKENFRDKIVLMSIDVDPTESAETLESFAQEFPHATWIWARDTANLAQAYEVMFIPKTVIIDQDGYTRFTHTGVMPASTFIIEIEELLS